MKNCNFCGVTMEDNSNFCSSCGKKLMIDFTIHSQPSVNTKKIITETFLTKEYIFYMLFFTFSFLLSVVYKITLKDYSNAIFACIPSLIFFVGLLINYMNAKKSSYENTDFKTGGLKILKYAFFAEFLSFLPGLMPVSEEKQIESEEILRNSVVEILENAYGKTPTEQEIELMESTMLTVSLIFAIVYLVLFIFYAFSMKKHFGSLLTSVEQNKNTIVFTSFFKVINIIMIISAAYDFLTAFLNEGNADIILAIVSIFAVLRYLYLNLFFAKVKKDALIRTDCVMDANQSFGSSF